MGRLPSSLLISMCEGKEVLPAGITRAGRIFYWGENLKKEKYHANEDK
jgi:hypothetical protein